jgi:hypothetical protein
MAGWKIPDQMKKLMEKESFMEMPWENIGNMGLPTININGGLNGKIIHEWWFAIAMFDYRMVSQRMYRD